ncbi:MAG: DUF1553 domain-containing protein [Planctomycetes bacterium]|nr:DUF1553 domain-containing protein [Planctomycetota bacterium]
MNRVLYAALVLEVRLSVVAVLAMPLVVGAQCEAHWSYRPVERPSLPAAVDGGWGTSPVDRFALEAMRARGLGPSPAAAREAWLRRVTLDLTGLPPTLDELDAFVADSGDGARERVVDRLLQTDAFAERWAAWWLDLARYADSQGYEKDALRNTMWRYRDQVIDAFGRGQPFDQFTVEQLAGDLLPGATVEQRLATAFHRQTMSNTEGGTDDEEFRVAAVVDRVDTTMQVWMGSTLGCAQCHDHKYDPFSQKEFFELFAFFDQTEDADRNDDAPLLRAPTENDLATVKAIELELSEVRRELAQHTGASPSTGPWHLLGPVRGDGFVDARDRRFAPERDGVQLDEEQEGLRWQERRDLVDGKVHTWQGDHSAFYLHRTVTAEQAGEAVLSLGADDALAVWCNGERVFRDNGAGAARLDEHRVAVALRQGDNQLLLKVTNGGGPGGFAFELWAAGEVKLRQRLRDLERDLDASRGPLVPVMKELPADRRRTTRIHIRGSFLDQGEEVRPGTPKVWPPLPDDAPRNRLGLARWLVSNDNPLTARVLANRIWSELFGQGIVATLEDFGTQGDRPTHPELLDWLACEFIDSGWSLRHLLRTIVLSSTYGQSSKQTARHRELDPDNRWLSRGPAFRLTAEQLRDQALAVAGLLRPKVGGPSVMPPQPDGIWRQIYSGASWQEATGEDRFRRALYTFWRRTSPHPAMLVFDMQSREACVLRRQRTNTPLQALVLWNDPQFHEPARALGERAMQVDAADPAHGVIWMWRRCLLREPTPMEVARLLDLLEEERRLGASERDAWRVVASVVMCLDEFVSKR